MRLEDLYPNFGNMNIEEQAVYVTQYRHKRAEDLQVFAPARVSKKPKQNKLELTTEEKLLMKALGLKQKDMLALKSSVGEEVKESEDNIFVDDTYEEEEDDVQR